MKLRRDGIPKDLKWRVLDRDNYCCRYCGVRGVPMEIDHVFPESRGGPTVAENLVTACEPCNRAKRDRLGIYPLPLDYLDKLNRAQAIIDWYKDVQKQMIEKELGKITAEVDARMKAELERMENAFRFRQRVFAAIKAMPTIGIAVVILAGIWMVVQIHLMNTGRFPYPPAFSLAPYTLMFLSMATIPLYKRALDWYTRWPYPRYELVTANVLDKKE